MKKTTRDTDTKRLGEYSINEQIRDNKKRKENSMDSFKFIHKS